MPVATWWILRWSFLGEAVWVIYLINDRGLTLGQVLLFEAAFQAYQHERMNRSARVVLSSRFFGEVLHADAGARELRNDLLCRRNPEDNWEFDWLYKGI